MKRFCGPCWNGLTDKFIVWTIDSEWSARRVTENYHDVILHDLSLLDHFINDSKLSDEDYAYLSERGYISVLRGSDEENKSSTADVNEHSTADPVSGVAKTPYYCMYKTELGGHFVVSPDDGDIKSGFRCLYLSTMEIKSKLISIGKNIKEKHKAEFDALKAPYVKVVLEATPKQLLKMRKYGLQYIFFSDGWFAPLHERAC